MWKKLIEKLVSTVAWQKVKVWIEKSGLTNFVFLAVAFGVWFVPIIPAAIKGHVTTGALSIFVYLNWNLIRKLWKTKVEDLKDKIDEKIDKI